MIVFPGTVTGFFFVVSLFRENDGHDRDYVFFFVWVECTNRNVCAIAMFYIRIMTAI